MRREMRQISGVNRPLGVALSEKAHEIVRRTAADFRAHGIALLAERNAVHNAEQCKKSGRTATFSRKACETGAVIVTGFRAHNVSFLPQSKAEIQTLRRKTSDHA